MNLRLAALTASSLLAGCAGPAAVIEPPPVAMPAEPVEQGDPHDCLSGIECTLKTSRTLLFVYDYAALGAPLPERDGRELATPPGSAVSEWATLRILLPVPGDAHFHFSSDCLSEPCRYSAAELGSIYQRYLRGEACVLPGDSQRKCEF